MTRISFTQLIRTALLTGLITLLLAGRSHAVPAEEGTPVSITGELTVLYMDDFENKRAELQYFIKEKQSKKQYRLQFDGTPPGHLRSGATVKVHGKSKGEGGDIYLAASVDGSDQQAIETVAYAVVPAVSGEQKTIVLVANFQDAQVSCSVDEIRDLMFTDPNNQSVDDYYRETSQNQIWFSGEVRGTYTIDFSGGCSAPFSAYTDPMNAAAEADGVDISQFDRKVYVVPNTGCGYAGFGSVGNTPSEALIFTCGIEDVYAHELGHNMGMYHASTPNSEYGDGTGIMGAGGNGLRHLNSAHLDEMGWRSPAMNTTITGSGTYDIAPQSLSESQSPAPQILRIAKPDTGEYYYIAYRRPLGFDSNLDWWHHDMVTVHRYKGDGGSPTNTYLLDELAAGESFTDAVNNITVSHTSQTPDYATVRIDLNGNSNTVCIAGAPGVSLAPASQSGAPGDTLSYAVSVTNTDSTDCAVSNFALSEGVPGGWSGTLSKTTLSLAPGQTGTATLAVTSASSTTAGSYSLQLEAVDAQESLHAKSATATFVVNVITPIETPTTPTVPSGDTEAPTAPTNLTASANFKQVDLSWNSSSDNVAVAGYRVTRDGVLLADTVNTLYTDKSGADGVVYDYTVTAYDAAGNASSGSTVTAGKTKKVKGNDGTAGSKGKGNNK